MYGLEKKGKTPFEFDLEQEMRQDPAKAQHTLKTVEGRIQELKSLLRQGAAPEDFDNLGILLHGYTALQRILTRLMTKK